MTCILFFKAVLYSDMNKYREIEVFADWNVTRDEDSRAAYKKAIDKVYQLKKRNETLVSLTFEYLG